MILVHFSYVITFVPVTEFPLKQPDVHFHVIVRPIIQNPPYDFSMFTDIEELLLNIIFVVR